jgi:hypothetical protein
MSHTETVNITRDRGETYPINFTFITDKTTKAALDISSSTLTLTASTKKAPATGFASTFTSTGVDVTDGTDGKSTFSMITTGQSDNVGKFYYDIELNTGGELRTVVKGIMNFVQDITK